jgi:hypothetical protein
MQGDQGAAVPGVILELLQVGISEAFFGFGLAVP